MKMIDPVLFTFCFVALLVIVAREKNKVMSEIDIEQDNAVEAAKNIIAGVE